MGNALGFYNPLFYAQEALMVLEKSLGFAGRVHRGYDATPSQLGDTINISKPGTFTAQDAPASAIQDVNTTGTSIKLDQWKEVTFALTDKELTFTKEKIISDHIRPAAYAIADAIDVAICSNMYKDLYNVAGTAGTTPSTLADMVRARRMMQDALAPDDGQRRFAIDTAAEENFLQLNIFNQNPAPGTNVEDVVMKGHIGTRFGMELFTTQNIPRHTKGTMAAGGGSIALTADAAVGATQLVLKGSTGTLTGTLVAGDVLSIAGQTQKYVVTELTTAAGNAAIAKISPAVKVGMATDAVVTVTASHTANMVFHKNCFALATAPLSELGAQLGGVQMATVADPQSNLALRSRMWYDPRNSKVFVSLDVLFGFKTLDASLGARFLG